MRNKGFAMTEMVITLLLLSFFTISTIRFIPTGRISVLVFPYQYLFQQSQAMRSGTRETYDDPFQNLTPEIQFNSSGNVNMARTLDKLYINRKKIIVELGGGRLVFHE